MFVKLLQKVVHLRLFNPPSRCFDGCFITFAYDDKKAICKHQLVLDFIFTRCVKL